MLADGRHSHIALLNALQCTEGVAPKSPLIDRITIISTYVDNAVYCSLINIICYLLLLYLLMFVSLSSSSSLALLNVCYSHGHCYD